MTVAIKSVPMVCSYLNKSTVRVTRTILLVDLSAEEIKLLCQLLVEDQLKPIFSARPPEVGFGRAEELLDKLYIAMDALHLDRAVTIH
jgi:hypothetical protein